MVRTVQRRHVRDGQHVKEKIKRVTDARLYVVHVPSSRQQGQLLKSSRREANPDNARACAQGYTIAGVYRPVPREEDDPGSDPLQVCRDR